MREIELGVTYQDVVTKFKGTAVGHCEYLTGCNQTLLVPEAVNGEYKEGHWFDDQRLTEVRADNGDSLGRIVLDNEETPGADKPAPLY